jgi:16S rRNA (guanine(966)-N(2))-methyltransferase RsmD
MRVITGEFRGRKLESPDNNDIRPTSDKVKEACFNILMNDIYGSVCCDLFAGTGSLGIEALSRGAERCYFGDSSRDAVRLIKTNIARCGAEDRSVVFTGDYKKILKRIPEKVDIFFLDPPYRSGVYESCFDAIAALDLLAEDGIIIAEHETKLKLPEAYGGYQLTRDRKYGKTSLAIYRAAEETKEEKPEESNE